MQCVGGQTGWQARQVLDAVYALLYKTILFYSYTVLYFFYKQALKYVTQNFQEPFDNIKDFTVVEQRKRVHNLIMFVVIVLFLTKFIDIHQKTYCLFYVFRC